MDRRREVRRGHELPGAATSCPDAPSRGQLIPRLPDRPGLGRSSIWQALGAGRGSYSGLQPPDVDPTGLWYASNRASSFKSQLPPGIYGLSNEFLDTPWPKLVRVRQRFDALARRPGPANAGAELFCNAGRRHPGRAPARSCRSTGLSAEVGTRFCRRRSFATSEYGTRCSPF